MSELQLVRLGENPEVEAIRLKALYSNEGVDASVIAEFKKTVQAYTELSISDIAERIRGKYGGDNPEAYGSIPMWDGVDVGMVFWGQKDYLKLQPRSPDVIEVRGVNLSGWALRQYRNQGLGGRVLALVTNQANSFVHEHGGDWGGRKLWTSIDKRNLASRKITQAAGFREICPQQDKPERLIYEFEG